MKADTSGEYRDIQAKSIKEALSILDAAAQRSSADLKQMLTEDYSSLRRLLGEVSPQVKEALAGLGRSSFDMLKNTKEKAYESSRDAARVMDESVHTNAWWYIGGVAAVGMVIGYLAARNGRRSFERFEE